MEINDVNSIDDADKFLEDKLYPAASQRRGAMINTNSDIKLANTELLKKLKLQFTIDKEKIEREIASRPEGQVNNNKIDTVIGLHFILKEIKVLLAKFAFEDISIKIQDLSDAFAKTDQDKFDINYPEI